MWVLSHHRALSLYRHAELAKKHETEQRSKTTADMNLTDMILRTATVHDNCTEEQLADKMTPFVFQSVIKTHHSSLFEWSRSCKLLSRVSVWRVVLPLWCCCHWAESDPVLWFVFPLEWFHCDTTTVIQQRSRNETSFYRLKTEAFENKLF